MGDLEQLLVARHPLPEWVAIPEWRPATGYSGGPDRRVDVMAIATWPSRRYYRVAYEVKRSRADFRRELDQPDKRLWVEEHCHETWFVVNEPKVAPLEELPERWGLLVATKKGNGFRTLRRAAPREPLELAEGAWVSALRKIASRAAELERRGSATVDGRVLDADALDELVRERVDEEARLVLEQVEREREALRAARLEARVLANPLHMLAREAARYRVDWSTSDHQLVADLVTAAVARRLRGLTSTIERAHEELGALVHAAKDPG